jgi:uncharacterized spore protein YtfJ
MAGQKHDQSQLANELLERVGEAVGKRAQAAAIFGEPVQREGLTIIPVARARFGFGGGGGSGAREGEEGSGGGGGGGAVVSPVGYIELRDDGAAFRRITTPNDLVAGVVAGSLAALTLLRILR